MNQLIQDPQDQVFVYNCERLDDQYHTPRTTKLTSEHFLVEVTITQVDGSNAEVKIPDRSFEFFNSIVHQLAIQYPVRIKEVWRSNELKNASVLGSEKQKKRMFMLIIFDGLLKSVDQHFQLKKSFLIEKTSNPFHYTIQIVSKQYQRDKVDCFRKDFGPVSPHTFSIPNIVRIHHELDPVLDREDSEKQAERLASLSLTQNVGKKKSTWKLYEKLFLRFLKLRHRATTLISYLQMASKQNLKFRREFEDAFEKMGKTLKDLKELNLQPRIEQAKDLNMELTELRMTYEERYGIGASM